MIRESRHAIVVGHGLVGAQIGHELQERGWEVLWIDANRPDAASPLSIGLMRESWYRKHPLDYRQLVRGLEERYGIGRCAFPAERKGGDAVICEQLEAVRILRRTEARLVHRGVVRKIVPNKLNTARWRVQLITGDSLYASLVIVSAGMGTAQLIPGVSLRPMIGAALRFSAADGPVFKTWAPYRHVALVWHCDGYWWGSDGQALAHMTPAHMRATTQRLEAHGARHLLQQSHGTRPGAVGSRYGIMRQCGPGLWVATGGAKSSTVLAAWWAKQIAEAVD